MNSGCYRHKKLAVLTQTSKSISLSHVICHLNRFGQLTLEHFDRLFFVLESLKRCTKVAKCSNFSARIFKLLRKSEVELVIFECIGNVADAEVDVAKSCGGFSLAYPILSFSEKKNWIENIYLRFINFTWSQYKVNTLYVRDYMFVFYLYCFDLF